LTLMDVACTVLLLFVLYLSRHAVLPHVPISIERLTAGAVASWRAEDGSFSRGRSRPTAPAAGRHSTAVIAPPSAQRSSELKDDQRPAPPPRVTKGSDGGFLDAAEAAVTAAAAGAPMHAAPCSQIGGICKLSNGQKTNRL